MNSITITDQVSLLSYVFQNDRALGGLMNQIQGFDYPMPIVTVADVAARSGATAVNSKFGRRLASFVYRFTCDVLSERQDMLKVMRQDGNLKLVEFTTLDSLDLQFEAYINKISTPYTSMIKTPTLVELVSPDYRLFSQSLTEYNTSPTTSTGGTPIPTAIPIDFTISGSGTPNLTVVNGGNEPTPPTFVINGPGTTFTIQNITTGESMTISTTITVGETITIDVKNRTVTQGTTTNIYGLFSGDWFDIPVGTSEIFFNASSGTDANTSLDVSFRDAYIGV